MPEPARNKRYALLVVDGNEPGKILPIEKDRVTLGRKDCDIVLDDPEISRRQAAIVIDGPNVLLEDLGSTNGTYIEGLRIEKANLENGSLFRMGTHQLKFVVSEDSDE